MSTDPFVMIPVWVMDRLVGHSQALALYVHILRHYNKSKGSAWPSQDRLAELMCVNTRTVRRSLTVLENEQVITVVRGYDGYKRAVNQYRPVGTIGSPDLEDINVLQGVTEEALEDINALHMEDTDALHKEGADVLRTKLNITRSKELDLKRYLPEFEDFWNAYPKRVGKGKAHAAFTKATQHTNAQTIIQAAAQYAQAPGLPEKQYIPHPTTWLNAESWEDDLPAAHTAPKTKNTTALQELQQRLEKAAQADIQNEAKGNNNEPSRNDEITHVHQRPRPEIQLR
tara:strand:+ start:511 stop:1365 length:855 start_codon:yes stop_codon:yes gene_type:complete